MISDFHFIRPYWLLALLPCLILIVLVFKHQRQNGNWATVCDEELLPFILEQNTSTQKKGLLISTSIAAILVILALGGPAWERLPTPAFRNDSGLVIALDLSRSMLASDIKPSRLIRARYKITDILKQRKDGQTALVVYAGDAFVVTPLTTDNATIESQLGALTPDIIPSSGSNTVLALEQSIALFKQAGLQKGHILLVTDEITLDESIDFLQDKNQYEVSVLAVGTENGAPIKLPSGGFLKDQEGNIVIPKLSYSNLAALAAAGNGEFIKMTDDNRDVNTLFNTMTASAKNTKGDSKSNQLIVDQWDDKGAWLLLLVLPLVVVNFRRGLLIFAFIVLIPLPKNSYAIEWQDLWETKDQQAQKLYQKNDFSTAAKTFKDPYWKAAAHYKAGEYDQAIDALKNEKNADSYYNQGNALAKKGQLEQALTRYQQALELNKDDQDILYNKNLVEKALEKQKKQQQEEKKQQQKKGAEQKKQDSSSKKGNKSESSDKDEAGDQTSKSQKNNDEKSQEPSQKKPEESEQKEAKPKSSDKSETADQASKAQKNKKDKAQKQKSDYQLDENQQATQQWLNRVPDDPSGLLRRKFEYQYKLRQRNNDENEKSW
ncbi:MAG: VWA domain-containing protein [Methylococcales bacterium]|nr:VWA domain-containing protein [Methylococcales bacterium]